MQGLAFGNLIFEPYVIRGSFLENGTSYIFVGLNIYNLRPEYPVGKLLLISVTIAFYLLTIFTARVLLLDKKEKGDNR